MLLALLLAVACAQAPVLKDRRGQVDGTAFEFSSGGTDLTDDSGAWIVRARGDSLWIAWFKNGKTREYGAFKITGKEASKLWRLVEDAEIHRRKPGRGLAPQVPVYSFTVLRPKKQSHTVTISVRTAQNDAVLGPLVGYLGKLIKKYAGKKPRLEPE